MLQNNIFMLSKPISFFLKTTLYLLHSKVPYFIFKRYIFHLRDKGLSNFQFLVFHYQGSPKKLTMTPTCFGGIFRCCSQNPKALNVLTSFSF